MSEVQNQIVGIVGPKGTGKRSYLKTLLRYCPRFLVFDVMAEHAQQGGNRLESHAQLAQFLKWIREQTNFGGFYLPDGALDEEIEDVSRLVYKRGHLCFAYEEVPLYTQPGYMPPFLASSFAPDGIAKWISSGPHNVQQRCRRRSRP